MFLSNFSVKKPIATLVLIIGMMCMGLLALKHLRVNQNPDVEIPIIVVTIPYPGASPETSERELIERLEKQMLARRLSASVEQSGGRLLAVIAHATGAPPDDGEAMRRELAAQGIAVLDLRDVLSGADGAALFLPCGHWTDEAHRRVARAIADELQRRHWM